MRIPVCLLLQVAELSLEAALYLHRCHDNHATYCFSQIIMIYMVTFMIITMIVITMVMMMISITITMVMMSIHRRYRGFSVCPGVPAGEESSLSLYTIVLICYRHCGHNHNIIIVIRASFIAHNVSLLSSPLPTSSPVLQSRGFKRCSMSDSLKKIPP